MGEYLHLYYDICLVAIVLIALYQGMRRGFLKSAVTLVLMVVAFFASWFLSEVFSPLIYDNFMHDPVTEILVVTADGKSPVTMVAGVVADGGYGTSLSDEYVTELIEGYSYSGNEESESDETQSASDFFTAIAKALNQNGAQQSASSIASSVEETISSQVEKFMFNDYVISAVKTVGGTADSMKNVVQSFLFGTAEETAEVAEQEIIRPVAIFFLKLALFVVLLFIMRLIITPVSNMFRMVNKIPIIGAVNVLLGGILGAAEGLIMVYAFVVLIKIVVGASGNSLIFLNNDVIDATRIFKYIYNFNIHDYL